MAGETGSTAGDVRYCRSCGNEIKREAELCPECGVRQEDDSTSGVSEKDPGIAAVLSFLIPGVGQLYNEQIARGVIVLVAYAAFWLLTIVLMFVLVGFLMLFAAPLFHVIAAWDAYDQASKINTGAVTIG